MTRNCLLLFLQFFSSLALPFSLPLPFLSFSLPFFLPLFFLFFYSGNLIAIVWPRMGLHHAHDRCTMHRTNEHPLFLLFVYTPLRVVYGSLI